MVCGVLGNRPVSQGGEEGGGDSRSVTRPPAPHSSRVLRRVLRRGVAAAVSETVAALLGRLRGLGEALALPAGVEAPLDSVFCVNS